MLLPSHFALSSDDGKQAGICAGKGTRMKPAGYDWQDFYEAAILETDDGKLVQRVREAKAAIDSRLEVLQLDHGGTPEERQAIVDALAGLNVLRSELETRIHE